jgi:erythromycin esterase-like protein
MAADSPRQLLHFALDDLSSVDSLAAASHRARIDPLLGEDALWENPEAAMNPDRAIGLSPDAAALRIAAENLISDLHANRPGFVAAQGMERFLEAMHHAAQARQLLNYHAALAKASGDRQGRLLGIRGAIMADNLSFIASRERPRGKVLVFAHNAHLQRSKVEWQFGDEQVHWWPVGAHLDVLFGSRYAAIASAVGTSPENGITEPEAGTLEALLTATQAPLTLLPTHRGRGLPSEALNALSPRSGSTKNGSYSPLSPRHLADFDWLLTFSSLT